MNVVLLVVDSLRAHSLALLGGSGPATPFLDRLGAETLQFRRAYATECWTLPSHASMFTGLLPSEHGAHFQHLALDGTPTIAERLAARGVRTSMVTRNFVFDGTVPGITRGFARRCTPLAAHGGRHPFGLFLAIAKPRVRRHLRRTGFFHPLHRDSRAFLTRFARALMPADELALAAVLEQMREGRARREPYFIFCNLYDVHAPYAPATDSVLEPCTSLRGCVDNLIVPWALSRLGAHTYLRPGFRLPERSRRVLLGRYERAVALMDAKLAAFHASAAAAGLLDDTVLIVTSDHGEAFGEHDLYLHDASVYDTHLHVPLWIRHPHRRAEVVDDVVSLRGVAGVIADVAGDGGGGGTLLDPAWRAEHPVAIAEHFHYPHAPRAAPRYRQNVACAIVGDSKFVVRREGVLRFDLASDRGERRPRRAALDELAALARGAGAVDHLRAWSSGTA